LIESNNLKDNDFHFYETLGYVHMVLQNNKLAIENYRRAVKVAKDDSWEKTRSIATLKKIQNIDGR